VGDDASVVGLAGNDFVSGLAFQVPFDFPGGINPVTWSGTFSSDTSGLTIHWHGAAAVYNSFSNDYNSLGVKPTDDNSASIYQNSDHAGTPENFKPFVVGGARGGGDRTSPVSQRHGCGVRVLDVLTRAGEPGA